MQFLSKIWHSKALFQLAMFFQSIVSVAFLAVITFFAIIVDIYHYLRNVNWRISNLWQRSHQGWIFHPWESYEDLMRDCGIVIENHIVKTQDGYHLALHRLRSIKSESGQGERGPVLLQHGLFQTCLPFILMKERSLAVYLLKHGYDVWLGNNRGNLRSRAHDTLSPSDARFWDFCIDDLAWDVEANVAYIRQTTNQRVVYVGHSQGCSQALIALSTIPQVRQDVRLFIALAPGAFVLPFATAPLRALCRLYHLSHNAFFAIFGRGPFLPFMEFLRALFMKLRLMPAYSYLAYVMFKYLMEWSDENWDKSHKNIYFRETPGGTSVRVLAQWMQHARSGHFHKYCHGCPKINTERYGSPQPPQYPLHEISTPVAIFYGGKDNLLDFSRLISSLPRCVMTKRVPHHEHLDTILSTDADEHVFEDMTRLMKEYQHDGQEQQEQRQAVSALPSATAAAATTVRSDLSDQDSAVARVARIQLE